MPKIKEIHPKVNQYLSNLAALNQLPIQYPKLFNEQLVLDDLEKLQQKFILLSEQEAVALDAMDTIFASIDTKINEVILKALALANHYLSNKNETFIADLTEIENNQSVDIIAIKQDFTHQLLPFHFLLNKKNSQSVPASTTFTVKHDIGGIFGKNVSISVEKLLDFVAVLDSATAKRSQDLQQVIASQRRLNAQQNFEKTFQFHSLVKRFFAALGLDKSSKIRNLILEINQSGERINDAYQVLLSCIDEEKGKIKLKEFVDLVDFEKDALSSMLSNFTDDLVEEKLKELYCLIESRCVKKLWFFLLNESNHKTIKMMQAMKESLDLGKMDYLQNLYPEELTELKIQVKSNNNMSAFLSGLLLKDKYHFVCDIIEEDEKESLFYLVNQLNDSNKIHLSKTLKGLAAIDSIKSKLLNHPQIDSERIKSDNISILNEIRDRKKILLKAFNKHHLLVDKINQISGFVRDESVDDLLNEIDKGILFFEKQTKKIGEAWQIYINTEKTFDLSHENIVLARETLQRQTVIIKDEFRQLLNGFNAINVKTSAFCMSKLKEAIEGFNHDFTTALSVFFDFPLYKGQKEEEALSAFVDYKTKISTLENETRAKIAEISGDDSATLIKKTLILREAQKALFSIVRNNKIKPWDSKIQQFFQDLIPGKFKPPFTIDVDFAKAKLDEVRKEVLEGCSQYVFEMYRQDVADVDELFLDCNQETSFYTKIKNLRKVFLPLCQVQQEIKNRVDDFDETNIKQAFEIIKMEKENQLKALKRYTGQYFAFNQAHQAIVEKIKSILPFIRHMKENYILQSDYLKAFSEISLVVEAVNHIKQLEDRLLIDEVIEPKTILDKSQLLVDEVDNEYRKLKNLEQVTRENYIEKKEALCFRLFEYQGFLNNHSLAIEEKSAPIFKDSKNQAIIDSYYYALEAPLKEKWFIPDETLTTELDNFLSDFEAQVQSEEVKTLTNTIKNLQSAYFDLKKENGNSEDMALLTHWHHQLTSCLHQHFAIPELACDKAQATSNQELLSQVKKIVKAAFYGDKSIEQLSKSKSNSMVYALRLYVFRPIINLLVARGVLAEEHLSINTLWATKLEAKIALDTRKLLSLNKERCFFKPQTKNVAHHIPVMLGNARF